MRRQNITRIHWLHNCRRRLSIIPGLLYATNEKKSVENPWKVCYIYKSIFTSRPSDYERHLSDTERNCVLCGWFTYTLSHFIIQPYNLVLGVGWEWASWQTVAALERPSVRIRIIKYEGENTGEDKCKYTNKYCTLSIPRFYCEYMTFRKLILSMRTAFFWGITQRRMVILYRLFGRTYRSHLQGSRSPRINESRHENTRFI
jgi:hypothetical protein